MTDIAIVLLAAGSSTRMRRPKQLLPWDEVTLIEFQLKKLSKLNYPVYVVLGSAADEILQHITNYEVRIVINENWKSGMGTSVSAGMHQVFADLPKSKAVMYALIDQPLVSTLHLQKLIDSFVPGQEQIVVSRSEDGWLGVPALYDSTYFSELEKLTGESGAKTLIKKYPEKVLAIDAGDSLKDMDTQDSYKKLLEEFKFKFK